jgi:hypothetical protein
MSVNQRLLVGFQHLLMQIRPLLAQPRPDEPARPFHAQVLLRDDLLRICATVGGTPGSYAAEVLQLLCALDLQISVMKVERSERELRTELAATTVEREGAVLRAVGRLTAYDLANGTHYGEQLRAYWWELAQRIAELGTLRPAERTARLQMIRDVLFPEQISPLNRTLADDYAGFAEALRQQPDAAGAAYSDLQHDIYLITYALATAGGYLARAALALHYDLMRLLDRVSGPPTVATQYDLYRDSRVVLDEQFPRTLKRLQRQAGGESQAVAAIQQFFWRYAEAVAVEIEPPTAELQQVLQLIHDRLFGGIDVAWLRSAAVRAVVPAAGSAFVTQAARYARMRTLIETLRGPLQEAQPADGDDRQRAAEQLLAADLYEILQRAGRTVGGAVAGEAIELFYYLRIALRAEHDVQPLAELRREIQLYSRVDAGVSYDALRSLVLLERYDERAGTQHCDGLRELLREFAVGAATAGGSLEADGLTAIAAVRQAIADPAVLSDWEQQVQITARSHGRLIGRLAAGDRPCSHAEAAGWGMIVLLHDLELLSRQARAWNLQDLQRMRRQLHAAERLILYALGPSDDATFAACRAVLPQLGPAGRPLAGLLLQQQDRLHGTRTAEPVERLYQRFSRELRGDTVDRATDRQEQNTELPLISRIRELLAAGDDRGAFGVLEAALLVETEPAAQATILCLRADAARRLGLAEAALRDLEQAEALAPAGSDQQLLATVTRCELLLSSGEAEQAAAAATELLRMRPEADQLLLLRAAAQLAAGRPQAAVLDYQRVLERQPGRSDLLLLRAEAQAAAGEVRQALAEIAQVLKLLEPEQSAEQAQARHLRGRLYLQLADVEGVSAAARDQLLRTVRDDYRAMAADLQLRAVMPVEAVQQLELLETRLSSNLLAFPLSQPVMGGRAVG